MRKVSLPPEPYIYPWLGVLVLFTHAYSFFSKWLSSFCPDISRNRRSLELICPCKTKGSFCTQNKKGKKKIKEPGKQNTYLPVISSPRDRLSCDPILLRHFPFKYIHQWMNPVGGESWQHLKPTGSNRQQRILLTEDTVKMKSVNGPQSGALQLQENKSHNQSKLTFCHLTQVIKTRAWARPLVVLGLSKHKLSACKKESRGQLREI